jgi:hypothetical protein
MIEGLEGVVGSDFEEQIEGVLGEIGVPANMRKPVAKKIVQKAKAPVRQAHAIGQKKGRNSISAAASFREDITSKGYFEMKKGELFLEDPSIQEKLANRTLQVVDSNIYGVKGIDGKNNIDILTSSDDKAVGKSNVNNAKLDLGEHFLVTGIKLLYGVFTTDVTDCEFTEDLPAHIRNGEFELKAGSETLLPENLSCEVFCNNSGTTPKGVFKLANPKWIKPQTEIRPRLVMPTAGTSKEAVKVVLIGARVHKK